MIKSIWIEIRPALKCCHFCVVFSEGGISSEVKMKIKKSSLMFDLKEKSFCVNFKDFMIEPLTMTALKFTSQCLSFRIQAECNFTFKKQSLLKPLPLEFVAEKFSFLCQCHNPLTCEIAFERKLPLPSNELSLSDMFCHFPSNLEPSNSTPRLNDCFYSDNLIVVNEKNLINCKRKGKLLICERCLISVGTQDKESAKFWVSCIKLPFDKTTPFEHFKNLIQKAISNPVTLFPKILLECEENETYLSMLVVDKNLVVSNCQENLLLKNMEVVKLKYKFHTCCDSDVKQLKEDPFHSLYHIQVHKSMLDFGTKYLLSCSKTIPSIFSKVDNDCMAYLNLSELQ